MRGRFLAGLIATLITTSLLTGGVSAQEKSPAQRFPQVDVMPLLTPPSGPGTSWGRERTGWLILNPVSRRAYQVFEGRVGGAVRTAIQSFDLDTLRPLRRAELAGMPVLGGGRETLGTGGSNAAAEVIHAVDPEGGRLYLAMSQGANDQAVTLLSNNGQADAKRALARFVMIDEKAFDDCAGAPGCAFAASFREPAGQERLHAYWVEGMAVTRRHTEAGALGRLLVLFAQSINAPFYDHTLAQWEWPATLRPRAGDELDTEKAPTTGLTVDDYLTMRQADPAGGGRSRHGAWTPAGPPRWPRGWARRARTSGACSWPGTPPARRCGRGARRPRKRGR